VAALLRLTELTLLYPHPYDTLVTETGMPLDRVGITHSTTLEFLNACTALPDFDALQIAYFVLDESLFVPSSILVNLPLTDRQEWISREQVKGVKDLVVDSLKKVKAGCREGEGGRKFTLRVIKLGPYLHPPMYRMNSAKAEEFEV